MVTDESKERAYALDHSYNFHILKYFHNKKFLKYTKRLNKKDVVCGERN